MRPSAVVAMTRAGRPPFVRQAEFMALWNPTTWRDRCFAGMISARDCPMAVSARYPNSFSAVEFHDVIIPPLSTVVSRLSE